MPVWRVSEPYINLWLEDEPLGYQPALGPRVSFTLRFKQRAENEISRFHDHFSSVGLSWSCSWLSVVDATQAPYGWAQVYYAGGGSAFLDFGANHSQLVAGNYWNNFICQVVTNEYSRPSNYFLLYPDGAQDVYANLPTADCNYTRLFYLIEKISKEGDITAFQYEPCQELPLNLRLKYVVDPAGGTNTISYAASGFSSNLITQVTDPFGRSTYLSYDTNGLLTQIVDVAGLTNTIAYNELGWATNLTTLYGPQRPFGQLDVLRLQPHSPTHRRNQRQRRRDSLRLL